MRTVLSALTLAAVAGLAAACGGSGSTSAGSATPSTVGPAASSAATAASPTAASPTGAGQTITATETDFHIALSTATLHAGTYTVVVDNAGGTTHALTFDGPGVSDRSTGDISPGASKSLTITLAAGTYEVYCPVGDHKMLGMDTHVTVS